MNKIKKLTASIAAFTTVATMGIGCISASANGLTKVDMDLLADTATAEEKFVASYEKSDEKLAASYYIENGISLVEAQTMMDIYQEGSREIAASKISANSRSIPTGTNFYSTTNLSNNQHYGVIIANNGSACTSVTLNLNYDPTWIAFNSSLGERMLDSTSNLNCTSILPSNLVTTGGVYIGNKTTETPSGVVEIPFSVTMTEGNQGNEGYSEGTLYHKFTFTRASSVPINGDSTFRFETYVSGDVNHDGIVNSQDVTLLTRYNTQEITDLSHSYTDRSNEVASIINNLAADADRNGEIGIADVLWIQHHME